MYHKNRGVTFCNRQNAKLWISYWRGDRLKERLKLEKKDSTGLLSQAKQMKERMEKKKTTDPKRVETSTKMGKKDILNSKLV
ncbi:hypothetical protein PIB30_104909, partial [Stylosanthes scabra]|nr:hypothetical protein [Stylosanthes scabra]